MCNVLALFLASWIPGFGPASYAGNTTEYTVCFSLSNLWNVLTKQSSHSFSHTVALFTLASSGSSCSPSYFYTRYIFASLSVTQSFWGPCQEWYYQNPCCRKPRLKLVKKSLMLVSLKWEGRSQSVIFLWIKSVCAKQGSHWSLRQGHWQCCDFRASSGHRNWILEKKTIQCFKLQNFQG